MSILVFSTLTRSKVNIIRHSLLIYRKLRYCIALLSLDIFVVPLCLTL